MVMAPIDSKRHCIPPRPPISINKPKHDFGKMDTDKSGTVSQDEYVKNGREGMVSRLEQRLRSEQFKKLDLNKDGQLDKKEQFIANLPRIEKPEIKFPEIKLPELKWPKIDVSKFNPFPQR